MLLHEIAHALAGPRTGHGAVWREIAERIGARPEVLAPGHVAMPEARWALVCMSCRTVVARRHRRVLDLARVRCGYCAPSGGELEWHDAEGD